MTQVEYRKLDSRLYAIESAQESIQEMLMEYVGKKEDQRQQSFEFSNENLTELTSLFRKVFSIAGTPEDEPKIDYKQITKTAHDAIQAVLQLYNKKSKTWEYLSEENQQQAVDSARHIYYDDDVTPEKLHKEFLAFFSHVDVIKEESPERLVPYDELPDIEKIRYILYITIIKSFKK